MHGQAWHRETTKQTTQQIDQVRRHAWPSMASRNHKTIRWTSIHIKPSYHDNQHMIPIPTRGIGVTRYMYGALGIKAHGIRTFGHGTKNQRKRVAKNATAPTKAIIRAANLSLRYHKNHGRNTRATCTTTHGREENKNMSGATATAHIEGIRP